MTREDRRRIRKKIISILAPICLLLILLGLILAHILNEPDYALISIAGIILTAISCVAITLIELILAARAKKKVLKAKIIGYNWVYTNVSTNFLPGIGGYEVHPIAEGYLHNLPIY